ncbi:transcription elongation factor GreA [Neofamilia massiliensis]|uniref:transcription elongation factor GreA n=1 Tax=Neofamilia massiliensis TaxID=1673724 RepID=UPI0006BB7F91
MVDKEFFFTEEGLKKTEDELEHLKSVVRREVAEKIKIALGYGDLSENAEYDHAKNEQAKVEEKIAKLENMLRNAVLIEEEKVDKTLVNIGSVVKVKEVGTDDEEEYTIVGSAETDPLEGKISNESPMGSALLGKKVGDIAEVEVPDGTVSFEIVSITM